MTDKKIALITGANKGIGKEIARQLGAEGMTVLIGARDAQRGEEAAELRAAWTLTPSPWMSRTKPASAPPPRGFKATLDGGPSSALTLELALLRRTYETNIFGVFSVTKAFVPLLKNSDAGRIVNTSSGLGSLAENSDPEGKYVGVKPLAYNSSKAALNMLTVIFAADSGYAATDLSRHTGCRTVEQAAVVAVRLATLPADARRAGFSTRTVPCRGEGAFCRHPPKTSSESPSVKPASGETMIIVTGANGQLGRAIVEKLLERVPASQVGASVRDPEKAGDLAALGVRVGRGDFDDPASLAHAFEGATQVLIVSSNASAYGGDSLAQHRSAIGAARDAGARRIVYTSHMAASSVSLFPPMLDHAATEDMLRQSGVAWTALRNGFYASSALMFMGDALKMGSLEAPADGKVSWATHADLAEAAAIILADEGRYDGPTPPLTASQALDLADLTAIASELQARPVHRQTLPDEEFRAKLASRGMPGHVIGIMMGFYLAGRQGEFAAVDSTLERLLGRDPVRMREVIAEKVGG